MTRVAVEDVKRAGEHMVKGQDEDIVATIGQQPQQLICSAVTTATYGQQPQQKRRHVSQSSYYWSAAN